MDPNQTTLLRQPTPHRSRGSRGFGLPPELLARARKRLSLLIGLMTITFVVVSLGLEIPFIDLGIARADLDLIRIIQLVAILFHVTMFLLVRNKNVNHSQALYLGLAYEVLICFGISMGNSWIGYRLEESIPHITFASLLIAVYPLIVPSPPRITLAAALAAAATAPLSFLVLEALGMAQVRPAEYLVASTMSAVSVAIALLGSRLIYGMNIDAAKARRLGSYQLETLLGRGGMGEVWRASHRMLARPAAIKLIRPEVLGGGSGESPEQALSRFEREAQVTATLCSSHTIQVYDYGVSDQGAFYYVMELLKGLDLDTFVERFGPLPAERVKHYLGQVCHSLAEAHEIGLIHRDIKPANLYVCRDGLEVDFIKVLDFGMVKSTKMEDDAETRVTGSIRVGGTPAYMSPEQVMGHRPIDARVDIYALGCVAYWLLTGRLVFEGTAMEIMTRHAQTAPAPPSQRSELEIPESVDRLVLSCLEKNPDHRPQSVAQLAATLAECETKEPWTVERAGEWWEVHRPDQPPSPQGESSG